MDTFHKKALYRERHDHGYLALNFSNIGYCLIQQALNFSATPSQTIEDSLQKLMSLKAFFRKGL